jgi:hypothetical protein
MRDYFEQFASQWGSAWNRFWLRAGDPLPLCLLRGLMGLLALYLVATYSPDLTRLFASDGLLPPAALDQWAASSFENSTTFPDARVAPLPALHRLSFLYYLTSPAALWVGHVAALLVLLALTLGLFSRIMSVLGLYVFLSYVHRAPMLCGQVEPVVAMVLFYLCLGPSGACLSIDACWNRAVARRRPDLLRPDRAADTPPRSSAATVALRLVQVHLCALYAMLLLSQMTGDGDSPVWQTGEAMWWIAARAESPLVSFRWLAHAPLLIDLWTHAVVCFEVAFPVLVWVPLLRPVVLCVGVFMWLLFALATGLGAFAAAMVVASVAFVSPSALRRCGSWRTCR